MYDGAITHERKVYKVNTLFLSIQESVGDPEQTTQEIHCQETVREVSQPQKDTSTACVGISGLASTDVSEEIKEGIPSSTEHTQCLLVCFLSSLLLWALQSDSFQRL